MAEANIASLFDDPVSLTNRLREIEEGYRFEVVECRDFHIEAAERYAQVGGKRVGINKKLIKTFDRVTGFAGVLKEHESSKYFGFRESGDEGRHSDEVSNMRERYLADSGKRVRALTYKAGSGAVLVSVSTPDKRVLLPTQVLRWLSLLREQKGLSGNVRRFSPWTETDVSLTVDTGKVEVKVGDLVNYGVRLRYRPSDDNELSCSTELMRLVCSNRSVVSEHRNRMVFGLNHDAGSARRRIEGYALDQIRNFGFVLESLKGMAGSGMPFSPSTAESWLRDSKVGSIWRDRIMKEYREKYIGHSVFDFFNAITSSRAQEPVLSDDEVQYLGNIAGRFLAGFGARHVEARSPRMLEA